MTIKSILIFFPFILFARILNEENHWLLNDALNFAIFISLNLKEKA